MQQYFARGEEEDWNVRSEKWLIWREEDNGRTKQRLMAPPTLLAPSLVHGRRGRVPTVVLREFLLPSENTLKKTAFLSIGIVFRSFETVTVR